MLMPIAEGAVATGSIWGVIGLIVTGLIGLGTTLVQDRRRRREELEDKGSIQPKHAERSSERIAATTASNEILGYLTEHIITPLRNDLEEARKKIEQLQTQNARKDEQLNEAHALVRDLNVKIISFQAQVAILLEQLGGVRDDRG